MDNAPKILPEPPSVPPELMPSVAPSPVDPSTTAAAPLSPEQLKSAGEDWATFTAMGLDFMLVRRGWTPTTATELEHMADRWSKVVAKYPALATPSKYPELGVLGVVAGMLMLRSKMEAEHLAAEAEKAKSGQGQDGRS